MTPATSSTPDLAGDSYRENAAVEAKIAAALARNDPKAAIQIGVRAYGRAIHERLIRRLGSRARGDEAFSLFGEKLARGFMTYRGKASFWRWGNKVATNAANDVAKQEIQQPTPIAEEDLVRIHGGAVDPQSSSYAWKKVDTAEVRAALEQFETSDQQLFQLRAVERLAFDGVAKRVEAVTGKRIAPPTLGKRFQRLRLKLRERLGLRSCH